MNGEPSRATETAEDELQYWGVVHSAACVMLWRLHLRSDRGLGDDLDVGIRAGFAALIKVIAGLPRLHVQVGDSQSGRRIHRHLSRRRLGIPKNRIAQGVLLLPRGEAEYLRNGRRIVRRNVRKALAMGLTVTRAVTPDERRRVIEQLTPRVPGMRAWAPGIPLRAEDEWWVAADAQGDPIAFAIFCVDREVAFLDALVSTDHAARYFLHTRIAGSLGEAGARYLLNDAASTLRMARNLQYFQFITGYRIMNLALSPDRARRRVEHLRLSDPRTDDRRRVAGDDSPQPPAADSSSGLTLR